MAKYNVKVEYGNENLTRGYRGLQFVLAGLVFLLAFLVVVIVVVYVHLTAAIADLSHRVDTLEGRPDSLHDAAAHLNGMSEDNSEEGRAHKSLQDPTKNQAIIEHIKGRSRRSDLKEKATGACASHEVQCRNGHCVNTAFVCDQDDDCGDGTDEENCGIDQCEAHICQNNATCRARKDGYTCICTKGWYGKYCQNSILQKISRMRHAKNYGMLDFDEAEYDDQVKYSIDKFQERQLSCVSPMIGSPPRHTCYTAGVLALQAGDRLVLSVHCKGRTVHGVTKGCWIYTDDDTTFWGAIKLSADVESN
uniref:EGF-like domain-containing protein n=1 Tax=Branchiostoma floridae TaxID=7739 RepID=C3YZ61_BRAFL|eukprot:XP_002598557.1 hypothetical protein BRAFLDRAFT_66948 [Branchiostoma floridae]